MMVSYLYIGALLLLSSAINSSNANNPCAGLPLCKLKTDVARSSGASSSSSSSLSSAPRIRSFLRRPSLFKHTTTTKSIKESLDQTTESEKIERSTTERSFSFRNRFSKAEDHKESDKNDGCFGLPLCVLSKSGRGSSVRATTASTTTEEAPMFIFDAGSSSSGSLMKEVLNGHIDEALQLIENGADVNEEDAHGNTVLHTAAQNGRLDVIRALLLGGADVNAENNHKNTPLQLAAQNGWTEITKVLLSAKKIEINKFDLHKNTALHLAAQNGQIGVAEELIKAGADVNPVNSHKHIPLHLSAQNGHLALSKLLVDNGGNFNYKDLIGNTPLHTAIHTTHIKIANMFINAGANDKIKNLSGLTAFQLRG